MSKCKYCGELLKPVGEQVAPRREIGHWIVQMLGECTNKKCEYFESAQACGPERILSEEGRTAKRLPPLDELNAHLRERRDERATA